MLHEASSSGKKPAPRGVLLRLAEERYLRITEHIDASDTPLSTLKFFHMVWMSQFRCHETDEGLEAILRAEEKVVHHLSSSAYHETLYRPKSPKNAPSTLPSLLYNTPKKLCAGREAAQCTNNRANKFGFKALSSIPEGSSVGIDKFGNDRTDPWEEAKPRCSPDRPISKSALDDPGHMPGWNPYAGTDALELETYRCSLPQSTGNERNGYCNQGNENRSLMTNAMKDFQDLFCTLMVALPLGTHRHRLTRYPQTFTTSEALNHLGNLRFTQSNRRPSPNDPNVMVTTKIATTFSMVAPMARSLCNKFLAARLVESIEGKAEFSTADSIWQLTPKGIKLLENFAHRNGVQERHVFDVLESPRNKMNLLVLEREPETDQLNRDEQTVNVIFRRFTGQTPNVPNKDSGASESEVLFDSDGNMGVKMHRDRKIANKYHQYTFSQRSGIDWLMNCCTLVDVREAYEILNLFVDIDYIRVVHEDKSSPPGRSGGRSGNSRGSIYKMTERGQTMASWIPDRKTSPNGNRERSPGGFRDSNTNRMHYIVGTPSLRLLFREYLKETHCEENLIFYLEVKDFLGRWTATLRRQKASMDSPPLDTVRETLAAAYDLYNAFLAPGSPCELNIDHNLRNALVSRMTRFELPDIELLQTVKEVIQLYDQAQSSVFKLMASDSVPKFLREPVYSKQIQKYNAEHGGGLDATSVTQTGRMAPVNP